ncbi:MAG: response regulator transcription factor, partial [Verrucomicrobiae bacterium]|nr:response regulator transcription factor [Verrucomicrobiae bacterium]
MKQAILNNSRKGRILVVDDHPLFREGVTQFINRQPDLEICGEADSVTAAFSAVETQRPDIVLLDLRLGHGDTLELIKSIKSRHPNVAILVISQYDDTIYVERALRAGADGYIVKQEASEEVLAALRSILAGEMYVSRKLAVLVLHKLLSKKPSQSAPNVDLLTDRELQVFQLIGSGLTTREIAAELRLSVKTVEAHREKIKSKLGLKNASELVCSAANWVRSKGPHIQP